MDTRNQIILVGPMGAGKTTLGRRLARHLKLSFQDTDCLIENECGIDIPTIFDIEGESGFREREHRILEKYSQNQNIVLATGGGIILRKDNRDLLTTSGWVIYLTVPLSLQMARLSHDNHRPLLRTNHLEKKLRQLHKERDHLYREVADWIIDTRQNDSHRLAKKIGWDLQREGIVA